MLDKKRFISIGLVCVVGLLVGACKADGPVEEGSATETSDAAAFDPDAEVTYLEVVPNGTLDPHDPANEAPSALTAPLLVFDRLIDMSDTGELVPGLAEEWSFVDGDLAEFQMKIREGVTFHDGQDLNAEAVVANFERMDALAERAEAGPTVARVAGLVESAEAVGEYDVVLHMDGPVPDIAFDLVLQAGMMVSPASIKGGASGADLDPIGTGAYMVEEFTANEKVTMGRYDDYWGGGAEDRPSRFVVEYVPEASTRLSALRTEAADVALLESTQVQEAEGAGLEVQIMDKLGLWMAYMNADGPLSDINLRKAILHAIDREAIGEQLFSGLAEPASQFFPEGHPAHNEEATELVSFDLDMARDFIAQSEYPDGVTLKTFSYNRPDYAAFVEAIGAMLKEINVTLDVTVVDTSEFAVWTEGNHDFFPVRFGGRGPDPVNNFADVVSKEGIFSAYSSVSPEIDQLIKEASSLPIEDPARDETIRELALVIAEEVAMIPIVTRPNVYAYQPGCIEGLKVFLAAGVDDWRNVRVPVGC